MSSCSQPICYGASTTCGGGCAATGCSWMHWRWSSSGALLHSVVITFLIETSKSGVTLSIQSSQPETLVCTSMVVWRWGHTSTTCCHHLKVHWDSWGWLSGLCHHMHWTLVTGLIHSRLDYCNIAVIATFNVCSPSSTQPYVWLLAHRDVITWPLWCASPLASG